MNEEVAELCIVREDPTQNERINIPSQIQMRNSRKAEKKIRRRATYNSDLDISTLHIANGALQ